MAKEEKKVEKKVEKKETWGHGVAKIASNDTPVGGIKSSKVKNFGHK